MKNAKRTSSSTKVSPNGLVDDQISVLLVLVVADDGRGDRSLSLGVVEGDFLAAESLAIDPSRDYRLGKDDGVGRVGCRVTLVDLSVFCGIKRVIQYVTDRISTNKGLTRLEGNVARVGIGIPNGGSEGKGEERSEPGDSEHREVE